MMLSDIYDFETGMAKPSITLVPDVVYVADFEPVKLHISEVIYIQAHLYHGEDCHIFSNERDCDLFIKNQLRRYIT